ncbi:MAG: bifunctional diaminohydroxyphosphoribosylaminopyrimidine deaminase/5-amino-6-(5-phosphoribosylamino)uracil reductase RibD [Planctomycetota bacterium]|nr:bifunctional diaminohydroxyphosphoribosylaminopyrimidine deaminase/5-amino-6-(5-phosphoribosylamino)uracil reductase RibD [Planctomycetota bacterium]
MFWRSQLARIDLFRVCKLSNRMSAPRRSLSDQDETFMQRALELAARARGDVEPNPMVGCVLVRDGQIIGEGYHHQFGGPHAEIDALQSLESPTDASGATAYVTLEPCCHHGKTPPCSQALVDAKIGRVVLAMPDPFPKVDGGGIAQIRHAGIETTVGVLQSEAEALNAPYLKLIRSGKPWVIAKWAMTLDGRIATASRDSQWITNPDSRLQTHQLRARVDGIAVGMGTVITDDPLLTARIQNTKPHRVANRFVFCRHRLPNVQSKLVQSARDVPLHLMVGNQVDTEQCQILQQAGAEVLETGTDDPSTMVEQALHWMGKKSLTNLMLEGGSELLASFFESGQIDECHIFLGAKVVGGQQAPGPIGGSGIGKIANAEAFTLISVDALQSDLRAVYRRVESP